MRAGIAEGYCPRVHDYHVFSLYHRVLVVVKQKANLNIAKSKSDTYLMCLST